jgi:hypothetical protein
MLQSLNNKYNIHINIVYKLIAKIIDKNQLKIYSKIFF